MSGPYAYREISAAPFRLRGELEPVPPKLPRGRTFLLNILALVFLGAALSLQLWVYPVHFTLTPPEATVAIDSASVRLGGVRYVWDGTHTATISAPGHESQTVTWQTPQTGVDVTLEPEAPPGPAGTLTVRTRPEIAAEISIAGEPRGAPPVTVERLPAGPVAVEASAEGFTPWSGEAIVRADETVEYVIDLTLPAGSLALRSTPPGADVLVAGRHAGRTPLTIERPLDTELTATVLLPGYTSEKRNWTIGTEPIEAHVSLKERTGQVTVRPTPPNATITINGEPAEAGLHTLTQTAHRIDVAATGYKSRTFTVFPHPDFAKVIDARLESHAQISQRSRTQYEKQNNLNFVRFAPRADDVFYMKTSRRRVAQALSRPFAVLDREVSNALFRTWQSTHDSGEFSGHTLNDPEQPAVSVSWDDAARFANWMSAQAGVTPFYIEQDGAITGFNRASAGYRLPTEAEWIYLTRGPERFVWGDDWPPPPNSGNLAGRGTVEILASIVAEYTDEHIVSAPVGSFAPNAQGLYDLPGNVTEWVHNVFAQQLKLGAAAQAIDTDPLGVDAGALHVIRGYGWRSADITELLRTARGYSDIPRIDLGFRLAYYLDDAP